MPERKPPGMSWQSFADRQIEDAQKKGAFDNLPGAGKPLPGVDRPYDENWWLRQLAEREGLPAESPALQLRREVEKGLEVVHSLRTEDAVRERLHALNAAIRKANATTTRGAPTNLAVMDVEAIVERWREKR